MRDITAWRMYDFHLYLSDSSNWIAMDCVDVPDVLQFPPKHAVSTVDL